MSSLERPILNPSASFICQPEQNGSSRVFHCPSPGSSAARFVQLVLAVAALSLGGVGGGMSCASRTPCQDAGPIRWSKKFDGDKICHQKQSTDGKWLNQGEFTWFHKNGKPALRGHYVEGKADGVWSEYDDSGEKIVEKYFENGVEKSFVDPARLAAKRAEVSLSRQEDPASASEGQPSGVSKKPESGKAPDSQAGSKSGRGDLATQTNASAMERPESSEGGQAVSTPSPEGGPAGNLRGSNSGTRGQAESDTDPNQKAKSRRGE